MSGTQAVGSLIGIARWFALATVDAAGEPRVSYVPFACMHSGFGIVVSGLAAHTAQLLAHPSVSLLIVGDPAPGDDQFARPRLSIDAIAHDMTHDAPRGGAIWDALIARHGETAMVLRSLPDFRPIELEPTHARLVLGFAAASDLDAGSLHEVLRSLSP